MLLYPDIIQHSNPLLAVVDSTYIRGGLKTVVTASQLTSIPVDQVKVYVTKALVTNDTGTPTNNGWWTLIGTDSTNISNWQKDVSSYTLPTATTSVLGAVSILSTGGLSITGGVLSVNANNGLTAGSSGVYLGGTLNQTTSINCSTYNLNIQTNNTFSIGGVTVGSYGANLYIAGTSNNTSALYSRYAIDVATSTNTSTYTYFNTLQLTNSVNTSFYISGTYTTQYNLLAFNTATGITSATSAGGLVNSTLHSIRFSQPTSIYNPSSASSISCIDTSLELNGTTANSGNTISWAPTTQYNIDNTTSLYAQYVINSGNIYKCVSPGISASSGGPTGTTPSTPYVDGSVTWYYIGPATGAPDYNHQLGNIAFIKTGKVFQFANTFNAVVNNAYGIYVHNLPYQFSYLNSGASTGIINNSYGLYINGDSISYPKIVNRYGIYQVGTLDTNVLNGKTIINGELQLGANNPVDSTSATATNKIKIKVNGAYYYLLAITTDS